MERSFTGNMLRLIHTMRFFLIATSILPIARNVLYRNNFANSYLSHYKQKTNRSRNQKKSYNMSEPLDANEAMKVFSKYCSSITYMIKTSYYKTLNYFCKFWIRRSIINIRILPGCGTTSIFFCLSLAQNDPISGYVASNDRNRNWFCDNEMTFCFVRLLIICCIIM